jgi:hypothetical protein
MLNRYWRTLERGNRLRIEHILFVALNDDDSVVAGLNVREFDVGVFLCADACDWHVLAKQKPGCSQRLFRA